jgi:hypothetical protein
MTAINDPRRLELMRCAYQQAVANCGKGGPSGTCPDCQKRFNAFYTGRPVKYGPFRFDPPLSEEGLEQPSAGGEPKAEKRRLTRDILVDNHVPVPGETTDPGTVTSNCLTPGCCTWFGYGCKKCVPKDCPCQYVGEYCGVYVWVQSGKGREELSKLTLAIMDYAVKDFATGPVKEVTLYRRVDSDGFEQPATSDTATKVVKVTIPTDDLAERSLAYPAERNLLWPRPTPGFLESLSSGGPGVESTQDEQPLTTFSVEGAATTPLERPGTVLLPGDLLFQERLMFERFTPPMAP